MSKEDSTAKLSQSLVGRKPPTSYSEAAKQSTPIKLADPQKQIMRNNNEHRYFFVRPYPIISWINKFTKSSIEIQI